jgi:hypothetical protein
MLLLAEAVAAAEPVVDPVMGKLNDIHGLVTAVLIIQAVIAIALVVGHMRITRNQVATADLLKQGVAKIEQDLPRK